MSITLVFRKNREAFMLTVFIKWQLFQLKKGETPDKGAKCNSKFRGMLELIV
jgi:hypothetical protein